MAYSKKDEAKNDYLNVDDEFIHKRRIRWDYFMDELLKVSFDNDPLYEINKVEEYENVSVKGEKALMMVNTSSARPNLCRSFNISTSFCNSKGNRTTFTLRQKKKRRLDDQTNNNTNKHFMTMPPQSLCTTKFDRERLRTEPNAPVILPSIVLNDRVFFVSNKENLFTFASNAMKEHPTFSTLRFNVCSQAPTVQQKAIQNQAVTCTDRRKKMTIREEKVQSFLAKLRLTEHIDRVMQLFAYIEEWEYVDMKRVALQKRWLELKDERHGEKYRGVMEDYCREFSKMRCRLSDSDIQMYIRFVLYTYSADLCEKLRRFQCNMKRSE